MDRAQNDLTAVWILGDQLSPAISSLAGVMPRACRILMAESIEHCRRIPYHKQKLVFIWSAMRHFAEELRSRGFTVDYYPQQPHFEKALSDFIRRNNPSSIRIMETAEYGLHERLAASVQRLGARPVITPNNLFVSDKASFQRTAQGKTALLMETFYRTMRRQTGVMMEGDHPLGGAWNYDKENRQPLKQTVKIPEWKRFPPDAVTQEVIKAVQRLFPEHFGSLEDFALPVTQAQAEQARDNFLDERLDLFGPFQDAMRTGEPTLFHSALSPLLNVGLLDPVETCRQAEQRLKQGTARLASVEGFIRQIIGWREFIYQVYHWRMPGYTNTNVLEADVPLPHFYWTADTHMACIRDAVSMLIRYGFNHHIMRLMITGNFALIAGIQPQEVNRWYWLAYVDAHEWVVLPNVLGMALYADGGLVATKPYAASANYINRMSDYCQRCPYDPKDALSDRACPFNALYWDFLARNEKRLVRNPRMAIAYRALRQKPPDILKAIRKKAEQTQNALRENREI